MHQTFYIESDEEITTIVERLRASKSNDVVLAAPRRALLLQSVINMRILRREADKQKKNVVIVTQDPDGVLLAQKAGLTVRETVNDSSGDEEIREPLQPEIAMESAPTHGEQIGQERVIGTEEYASASSRRRLFPTHPIPKENADTRPSLHQRVTKKEERAESILNHELVNGIAAATPRVTRNAKMPYFSGASMERQGSSLVASQGASRDRLARKEKALNSFFASSPPSKTTQAPARAPHVPRPMRRIVFSAVTTSVLLLFFVGLYVIFPYTVVSVKPKGQTLASDLDLSGDASLRSVDAVAGTFPVRLIVVEDQRTETFSASGTDAAAGQKARGTVTLYNAYSADSQRLVATTRLLAADGKLFRLVKDVTVPGMAVTDGTTVVGAIETEVIADQSGEEYNIAPTRFSVPGFQGTAKYEKFYAESKQPMSGGNTIGGTLTTVSVSDLAQAKRTVEENMEKELREKMRAQQKEGEVLLENAMEKIIVTSESSVAAGTAAQTFGYTARVRLRAIVFSEQSIRSAAHATLTQRNTTNLPIDPAAIMVEYGAMIPYFDEQKITLNAKVTSQLSPVINEESFTDLVRGKNQDQIRDLLHTMPEIESLTFSFWPGFLPGRVSFVDFMIKIIIAP